MGFIEFILEFILAVSTTFLTFCYRDYFWYEDILESLKGAPDLPIVDCLKSYVLQQENETVPYAVIRGTVTAIGAPIKSAFSSLDTGVLQGIRIFELRTDQSKLVNFETKEVPPFMITNGEYGVEVSEALSAAMLNWDMVYDSNVLSLLTIFGQLFGFLHEIKEGFQKTEEMLLEGSLITAVGEIELDVGNLRLQPSSAGPIFLTTATKYDIIEKLQEEQFVVLIVSAVLFIVLVITFRRWLRLISR